MEIDKTTWKTLKPLFECPTKGFTARELAKHANLSHTTVLKLLPKLNKEKIIKIETYSKTYKIVANLESKEFVKLKKIYNIEKINKVLDVLLKKYYFDVFIIFGSFAEGKDTEKSDVDIYLGYDEIKISKEDLKKIEKILNKTIDLFTGKLKKYPKELKENIINGIKIWGWIKIDEI